MDIAVELYKLSVSTLHLLKIASKEEQGDYVGAWYSMFLSCAQELKHGAALWQEFYHANVCDRVVSEGTNILHDQKSFIIWDHLSSQIEINYKLPSMLVLQVVTTLLLLGRYIELHRFYIYPCSVSSPGFLQILEC